MNAYLTYVCSDNFIPGVVALYNSVRLSNCNNDFIVLVTDDVSQESRDILNKKNLKIVDADKYIIMDSIKIRYLIDMER